MLHFKHPIQNKPFFRISLVIFICFIFSCKNKKDDNSAYIFGKIPRILVEPNQEDKSLNLSSIGKYLEVVKLENIDGLILSSFAQLIHVDNAYIIFRDNNRILIFDRKGKFFNEINAKGGGPKEYEGILNTYVDAANEFIYIIDKKNIKIYNYSGDYIKHFSNNVLSGGLSKLNEDGYILAHAPIFSQTNREMLSILDNNLNIIKTFYSGVNYDLKNFKQEFIFTSEPYYLKDIIHYKEPLADTIFKISRDSIKPHLIIDMHKYKLDIKDAITINKSNKSKNKILDFGFRESKDFLFFNFYYQETLNFSVYDKNLKDYVYREKYSKEDFERKNTGDLTMGIKNDFFENAPNFWPSYISDSLIASFISPEILTEKQLNILDSKSDQNSILFILNL